MKFPTMTATQSTPVNLSSLQNCVQMNTKDLSRIAIFKKE